MRSTMGMRDLQRTHQSAHEKQNLLASNLLRPKSAVTMIKPIKILSASLVHPVSCPSLEVSETSASNNGGVEWNFWVKKRGWGLHWSKWLRLGVFPMLGVWSPPLVRELDPTCSNWRFCLPQPRPSAAKKRNKNVYERMTSHTLSCKEQEWPISTISELCKVLGEHGIRNNFPLKGIYGLPGASQGTLAVKNLMANTGDIRDTGSIPGSGREHGNPIQYSCLQNSIHRGAWQATQSIGLQRVGHD